MRVYPSEAITSSLPSTDVQRLDKVISRCF
jgi:hypothetical protein